MRRFCAPTKSKHGFLPPELVSHKLLGQSKASRRYGSLSSQTFHEIRFPFLPNISRRETSDITLAPSKISDPSYVRTHALDNAGTAKLGATTKILHQTSLLITPPSSAHHWAGAVWWHSRTADRTPQVALSYEEPRMYGYTGGAVVYSIRANTTNVESGTWSPGDARHTQALIRQFSLIEAERAQTSSPAPGPRLRVRHRVRPRLWTWSTNVESGTWSPGDARVRVLIRQFSLIEAERAKSV